MAEQFLNKRHRLAFRLSLLIVASTILIFIAAFGYDYYVSRNLVMDNIREESRQLATGAIAKIETILGHAERPTRILAKNLDNKENVPTDRMLNVLEKVVAGTPEIFGSTVAFEPYGHNSKSYFFAPYYSKQKDGLKLTYLGKEYNYFLKDWYSIPRQTGRPVWSEPYYDEGGGNIVMSTFSAPFYKSKGGEQKFAGVVTADISLEWLRDITSELLISKNSYAFLISKSGIFVSHPHREWIMRESIFSIAEAEKDQELRKTGQDMLRGGSGFIPLKSYFAGKKAWMYYAPLPSTNWSLGLVIPEDELFSGLRSLNKTVFLITAAGICLLVVILSYISHSITIPLRRLASAATEISQGSLDTPLPPASRDEVGELISSFDNMRRSLKEYIANLKETTAAKERMESELKIGRTIQMSFLPQVFPPFPDRKEFDLHAKLEPAREVGGDLYGFSLVDENTLFFSIGDVSGKGVPAALFMAVTKTVMNAIIVPGIDPATILSRVNVELCRDNEESMFCTMMCGLLDLRTGECVYSNAGHNPPLVVRTGATPNDGTGQKARWLELPAGIILGVNEDASYQTRKIILNAGDMLLLYTDGVTEAMDENETLYSPERLIMEVEKSQQTRPEDLIADVLKSVQEFAGHAAQSDDITVLAVKFKGVIGLQTHS